MTISLMLYTTCHINPHVLHLHCMNEEIVGLEVLLACVNTILFALLRHPIIASIQCYHDHPSRSVIHDCNKYRFSAFTLRQAPKSAITCVQTFREEIDLEGQKVDDQVACSTCQVLRDQSLRSQLCSPVV